MNVRVDASVLVTLLLLGWCCVNANRRNNPYALGRNIPRVPLSREHTSSHQNQCEQKSCYPATGNLLLGREKQLWASSTCGIRRREKFCIVSHLKDSKKCFYCESNERTKKNPKVNHGVHNIVYKYFPGTREDSWWQSENGKENVTIQLDLEAEFHFTHLIITFKTFRPAKMLIERSYDFGRTWQVYRYFAADCAASYPHLPAETPRKLDDVICESRYSKVSPSTNGEVIFRVLQPQMEIDNPYKQEVQNLLKMTNLRINFTKLHTLGDDLLDNRAEIQEKYYYAITSMVVRGSCSCYGHASHCLPLDGAAGGGSQEMVHGKCACEHNTTGANCEECENFFNDLPWQPAIGQESNACKRCNCNNHADSCHFDAAVFQASGNVSGGVCDGCRHNTMGTHCEMCKPYYYLDPARTIQDPEACVPCDCDPEGSTDNGICDSQTDELNKQRAGSCHCKDNVEGRRCDTCRNGFWNLTAANPDGCQPCTCNTLGTIDNQGCDTNTGICTCKRYVTGRDCNQCLPEFWGLSDRRDGCQPCDCDRGGSLDNNCDVLTGQCRCRRNVQGRRCDVPAQGTFAPALDFLTYEAENAFSNDPVQIIIREPYRDGLRETPWTGDGLTSLQENRKLHFTIDKLPRTMDYDVVVRYEPAMPDIWENAIVHIVRPEPLDPNGPCANTKPSDDNAPVQFHPAARSLTVLPPTCLEADKHYEVVLELRRYKTHTDTPSASILIDSIAFIPRVTSMPSVHPTDLSEAQRRELEQACRYTHLDVVRNQVSEACKKYHISVSLRYFDGAFPCNCNETGSTSKLCPDYGGFCPCKPRVTGRTCSRCAPGTWGFGPEGCKPCDCSGLGSRDNFCDVVTGQCKCLNSNTYGRQCDQCRPGFWNFPNCQRCECNGHADTCDLRTGVCEQCRDATVGHACEQCADGFYGDPRLGFDLPCRPCPCPGALNTNHSHAATCALDPATKDVICECDEGYAGSRCSVCSDNYFGQPDVPGGTCRECDCNNNVDITRPRNCDPQTGRCLQCLFNTEGDHCEVCQAGFYGDAITQSCRQCVCDMLGTNFEAGSCDRTTGQCPCKENVVGLECNRCRENHWRIAVGNGCEACDCDPVGSLSEQCNVYDGQCECKQGFGGRRCDQCTANHWGNPTVECYPCECDVYGSETLQCNQSDGTCLCRTGIAGDKCDQCARGFLGTAPHCSPCGECFTNWDRILDERSAQTDQLIREVNNTIQVGTSGAYTQQFAAMEDTLREVDQLLNKTAGSLADAENLQEYLNHTQLAANATAQRVDLVYHRINEVMTNQTKRKLNLDELKPQIEDLRSSAERLRSNATDIQQSNVELALELTERERNKVLHLERDVASANPRVEEAERICMSAELWANRSRPELLDETKAKLAKSQAKVDDLLLSLNTLNEDVCDRKDESSVDICDTICGGAGCGKCGASSSCDEGAVVKVNNAEERAKETATVIRDKELKAEELLRNLSQINVNTSRAHDKVQNAYDTALETNTTSSTHLQKVKEMVNKINGLKAAGKDSPQALQEYVNKILALKIAPNPKDIQELATKITKIVHTLTDIDAILEETNPKKQRANAVFAIANQTRNDAEVMLRKVIEVNAALNEAQRIQASVRATIDQVNDDMQNINQSLQNIKVESEAAKEKSDDSVLQVDQLQKRVQTVKPNFLRNGIDAKQVETDAKKIVAQAKSARDDAETLKANYTQVNDKLAEKVQHSEQIKTRANELYMRAVKLNHNIMEKISSLNDLSTESKEKEEKLRTLEHKIDQMNSEMDEHLAHIRAQSAYYRNCN